MTTRRAGRSAPGAATGPPDAASSRRGGSWVGAGLAVAQRPWLWATAARQTVSLVRPGWWRTWPPVPTPPGDYLRFRLQTAYGGEGPAPAAADVVTYLHWCRQWHQIVRSTRRR